MALHGFEARGHRIVTFLRNDDGLPVGKPLSIVYGWDANGTQGLGNPVGLAERKMAVLSSLKTTRKKLFVFFMIRAWEMENRSMKFLKLLCKVLKKSPRPKICALIYEKH